MRFADKHARMPTPTECLPGRATPMPVVARHLITGNPLVPPWPADHEELVVGMGCFWGVERVFWQVPGVWTTAVGYAGGSTPNPTYEEVCTGRTGHNEVVRVIYDPGRVELAELIRLFWERHDPTQGMRQGNDVGTQYRSGLYWTTEAQRALAERSREAYQARLQTTGHGAITTEILPAPTFYYAEDYHQQYLHKHPQGYCGLGGTGVACPVGLST
ncbi:MAG: peptide-methionine (S)-S-oxide reductase MsrA [Kofleriaceae bacterium]